MRNDATRRRIDELDANIDRMEDFYRQGNVKFIGIDEDDVDGIPGLDKVVALLNGYSSDPRWLPSDIAFAFREGPRDKAKNEPRPLVVGFRLAEDKIFILRDQKLRKNMKRLDIKLSYDPTHKQEAELKFYRDRGLTAYYKAGQLHVTNDNLNDKGQNQNQQHQTQTGATEQNCTQSGPSRKDNFRVIRQMDKCNTNTWYNSIVDNVKYPDQEPTKEVKEYDAFEMFKNSLYTRYKNDAKETSGRTGSYKYGTDDDMNKLEKNKGQRQTRTQSDKSEEAKSRRTDIEKGQIRSENQSALCKYNEDDGKRKNDHSLIISKDNACKLSNEPPNGNKRREEVRDKAKQGQMMGKDENDDQTCFGIGDERDQSHRRGHNSQTETIEEYKLERFNDHTRAQKQETDLIEEEMVLSNALGSVNNNRHTATDTDTIRHQIVKLNIREKHRRNEYVNEKTERSLEEDVPNNLQTTSHANLGFDKSDKDEETKWEQIQPFKPDDRMKKINEKLLGNPKVHILSHKEKRSQGPSEYVGPQNQSELKDSNLMQNSKDRVMQAKAYKHKKPAKTTNIYNTPVTLYSSTTPNRPFQKREFIPPPISTTKIPGTLSWLD